MIGFFRITPKSRKVKIRGKNGLIYHNPNTVRKIIFQGASGLFLMGIIYLFYLYGPLFQAIIRYKYSQSFQQTFDKALSNGDTQPVFIEKVAQNDDFKIEIPKILATTDIVANVPPFESSEYLKALRDQKVAQAQGSGLPGESLGKSIYVFAHSTSQGLIEVRNNAVFYLLGELTNNDLVFIKYKDKIFTYKVYKQKIVKATDIQYLNYKEEGKEILILQTCWPIGTDWKRLLIFAEKV